MNNDKPIKAAILGLEGETLTEEEKAFFQEVNPLGFILFARNCKDKEQIKSLVASLKACVTHDDVPILIDQEGGRVARLRPPHWRKTRPAADFVALANRDIERGKQAVYQNARLIAAELYELGINVDCAPVVDLLFEGAHDIVGDRAYGTTPDMVAILAREVCNGLLDGGVLPIIKHIPGHGRAMADSHESLPVVTASRDELEQEDFAPFKKLADAPWAMTAHIIYTAIDKEHPATHSPKMVELIRKEIGFDGVLVSDDLSMKALDGSFEDRTEKVFEAGCDVVLHCNGDMAEMKAIASVTPALTEKAIERLNRGTSQIKTPVAFDFASADREVETLLSEEKVA